LGQNRAAGGSVSPQPLQASGFVIITNHFATRAKARPPTSSERLCYAGYRRDANACEGEPSMKDASLPITLIVIGAVGVIWYFRWLPDIDWIIALGFVAGGIAVLAVERINKNSIVTGPFLIAVGIGWWLRDQYRVSWTLIISALLVVLGVLMLIARNPGIPEKRSSAPKV
jgi:hypothetical protein